MLDGLLCDHLALSIGPISPLTGDVVDMDAQVCEELCLSLHILVWLSCEGAKGAGLHPPLFPFASFLPLLSCAPASPELAGVAELSPPEHGGPASSGPHPRSVGEAMQDLFSNGGHCFRDLCAEVAIVPTLL